MHAWLGKQLYGRDGIVHARFRWIYPYGWTLGRQVRRFLGWMELLPLRSVPNPLRDFGAESGLDILERQDPGRCCRCSLYCFVLVSVVLRANTLIVYLRPTAVVSTLSW
jgi:hypothetical protein